MTRGKSGRRRNNSIPSFHFYPVLGTSSRHTGGRPENLRHFTKQRLYVSLSKFGSQVIDATILRAFLDVAYLPTKLHQVHSLARGFHRTWTFQLYGGTYSLDHDNFHEFWSGLQSSRS